MAAKSGNSLIELCRNVNGESEVEFIDLSFSRWNKDLYQGSSVHTLSLQSGSYSVRHS